MSGVFPLLPLYAFMARTGANLDVAFCSFIGGLLTVTDSVSNCTVLGRTGTDMEESYRVLNWSTEVISQQLPRQTEKNHDIPQDVRYPGGSWNSGNTGTYNCSASGSDGSYPVLSSIWILSCHIHLRLWSTSSLHFYRVKLHLSHLIKIHFQSDHTSYGRFKSWSSSLCNFLHSPVSFSLLGPNVLPSALYSKTLNLCSCPRLEILWNQRPNNQHSGRQNTFSFSSA